MIPWVREKFAERRARWIASRKRNEKNSNVNGAGASSCSGDGTSSTSTLQNSSSLRLIDDRLESMTKLKSPAVDPQISKEPTIVKDKIRIRIISPSGRAKVIFTELSKKLIDLRHDALMEFCDDSGSLPYFATDIRLLIPRYRLIKSELTSKRMNDGMTLAQNGIVDNDTLLLSITRSNSYNVRNPSLSAPNSNEIFDATRNITCSERQPPTVDINEIFQQSNLQFDVRKVLISLAQTSAKIIGSGPFAPRLIDVLKQKLANKRTQQNETIQCLVDMGFKKENVVYALKLHNNVYASTLEWLILHQNDEALNNEYRMSSNNSNFSPSSILPTNNIVENTEALLEIVRIYSHREIPPPPETIRALVDMGFNENEVVDALKRTYNNKASACEWLCGNRSGSLLELREGLSTESPILTAILELPQVQTSLSNPKMFLAFLSILENENTLRVWGGDSDTTSVITHILQKYHEEKHVLGINQFHSSINSR